MYKLVLLLRYLTRPISLIPVLAVALAVYVLIVVIAVMNGFGAYIKDNTRGTLSDIVIQVNDARGAPRYRELVRAVQDVPGVAPDGVSPQVSGLAILSVYGPPGSGLAFHAPVRYIGIDLDKEKRVGALERNLTHKVNGFSDGLEPGDPPGLIVGDTVMRTAVPGMSASLTAPTVSGQDIAMSFKLVDLVKSGLYDFDSRMVYVPLDAAQTLLGFPDSVTGFHVKVASGQSVPVMRDRIVAALGSDRFTVKTWQETRSAMFLAIAMERVIWVTVLASLLVVAGFSILAVLTLLVVQKTRDIGVLRAIGGPVRGISGIFVGYGSALGLVGASVGLVLGWLTLRFINQIDTVICDLTGYTPWSRDIFYFTDIPCDRNPRNMVIFFVAGVLTALLSSLYPAVRAARLNPLDTLRYE